MINFLIYICYCFKVKQFFFFFKIHVVTVYSDLIGFIIIIFFNRLQANPEASPKLDWAFYKSRITTPGLVDKFQKEYEGLKVPFPEDKYTSQINAQEQKVVSFKKNKRYLIKLLF